MRGLLAPANWKEAPSPTAEKVGAGAAAAAKSPVLRAGSLGHQAPVLIRPFVPFDCPEHNQDDRAEGNKRDEPPPPGLPGVV